MTEPNAVAIAPAAMTTEGVVDRGGIVSGAMIHAPKISSGTTTVAEVRGVFRDDHVHCVLIVENGRLLAVVERPDIEGADPATLVRLIGRIHGRVIGPGADLATARHMMAAQQRRRLAVVDDHGALLGLLCLKRTGRGFCSDADVEARATERAHRSESPQTSHRL